LCVIFALLDPDPDPDPQPWFLGMFFDLLRYQL
jgi:hypothetical protein